MVSGRWKSGTLRHWISFMDKVKLEYILWKDPFSVDEWQSYDDIDLEQCTVVTYGQVIKENDSTIAVALNFDISSNPKKVSCVMIIPKLCIIERRVIEGVAYKEKT